MKVTVKITESFKKKAKPLLKKYPSLKDELAELENALVKDPFMWKSLGNNCYKIRLGVKSKGKGKQGGIRIISHLETELLGYIENTGENKILYLLTIYDKNEISSISDKELKDLIIFNMKLT